MRGGRALRGVGLAALLDQIHDARLAALAGHQGGQLLPHLIGLRDPPGDHLPQQDPQAKDVDLQHHMPRLSRRCSWGSGPLHHGPPASAPLCMMSGIGLGLTVRFRVSSDCRALYAQQCSLQLKALSNRKLQGALQHRIRCTIKNVEQDCSSEGAHQGGAVTHLLIAARPQQDLRSSIAECPKEARRCRQVRLEHGAR